MRMDTRPWGQQSLLEVSAPDLQFPRDAIDPRIDVDAQRALISMASGSDAGAINDAFNVLELVKTGRLGGIYKEDQRVPALLAQKRGIGWWQLFEGFGDFPWRFLCDRANPQKPPIVVLRRNLDRQRLIVALRDIASFRSDLLAPGFCGTA